MSNRLFHAAGERYREGDDLHSLRYLVEGLEIIDQEDAIRFLMERWDMDEEVAANHLYNDDGAAITFARTLEEAQEIREEYNDGKGVILAVECDRLREAGLTVIRNAEGYPMVITHTIPAHLLVHVE